MFSRKSHNPTKTSSSRGHNRSNDTVTLPPSLPPSLSALIDTLAGKTINAAANNRDNLTEQEREAQLMFVPGHASRTDQLPVDEMFDNLVARHETLTDPEEIEQSYALLQRTTSVSDLEPGLYGQFCQNPTSMAHWLPPLQQALTTARAQSGAQSLKIPRTQIHRLPPEMAQYIRVQHHDTNLVSRVAFNAYLEDAFDLPEANSGTSVFIKTGTFSDKFQGHNIYTEETNELGDYFHVINNKAMSLGAGHTVDLVVREHIPNTHNDPTIYDGLPLRTEFRTFIDLDYIDPETGEKSPRLLGIVDYWHPEVIGKHLANGNALGITQMQADHATYQTHRPTLQARFDQWFGTVRNNVTELLPELALTHLEGQWSLDIMLDGNDLYLIDMAPMYASALTELLINVDEYALVPPEVSQHFATDYQIVNPIPKIVFPVGITYDTTMHTLDMLPHAENYLNTRTPVHPSRALDAE